MNHSPFRAVALLSAVLLVAILGPALLVSALPADRQAPVAAWSERVDPALLRQTGTMDFLVVLLEQADLSGAATLATKDERGAYVYSRLTAVARRSQAGLLDQLRDAGVAHRPFWVHNMIAVRGDRQLLAALASRADVSYIYANTPQQVAARPLPGAAPDRRLAAADVLPHLLVINAPLAWDAGFLGQGAVIGGQDTGYDWTHPALKDQYRGWDGDSADHDYNWHDAIHEDLTGGGNGCGFDSPEPCDDQFHGTHTMGTMVGDEPGGPRTGVAPGADWVGCRNMEQGFGTPGTYSECFEWFIAPYPIGGDKFEDGDPTKAPDVINNSWSCPPSEGCTAPNILKAVVEAVTAAGIVTVQSAGNSGFGNCETIDTPAAIYDVSFTVAATELDDSLAVFSSLGPTPQGLRKPDISAPGTNVYSTFPGDNYGYLSGTSMAAPHVAGVVALLISAEPSLAGNVEELEGIIAATALGLKPVTLCGDDTTTSVPNNSFGWGRVDAWEAVSDALDSRFTVLFPLAVYDGQTD